LLRPARKQSSGIEQVNQAIAQMDQVTQQNAALVEEAAAAAESLQDQAAKLAEAVSVFKLDGMAYSARAELPVSGNVVRAIPKFKPKAVPARPPGRRSLRAPVAMKIGKSFKAKFPAIKCWPVIQIVDRRPI